MPTPGIRPRADRWVDNEGAAAVHVITDNDLFQRLAFDNPWWSFRETTKIRFRHPPKRVFFDDFHEAMKGTGDGRVLALAGPLRAGKTVMLRQMVAHLVEQGVPAHAILYCNLTNPSYTAADLATLFEMFCRRYRHGPEAELYVLFDEIQYVKDWEKAVLKLAEMRPKAHIVGAMSSGAPSTVQGATAEDGRIEVFVLPPLSFLEFLRFRQTEEALFGPRAEGRGTMTLRPEALPALNQEFVRYVNFGGFLEAVAGSDQSKAPAPTFIRDGVADRVLHKDLASLAGVNDPQELNKLFSLLAFNTGREVTIDDLAKATGTAKNTLRKYLDYLESAFLIRRLPRVDRDAKRFQRQVAFKVYLTSPCLYAALFGPVSERDHQLFPRLAETALVSQWLGSAAVASLHYASWRTGGVDLLSLDPATERPSHVYEIDWTDGYARPGGKGPKQLVDFVEGTNRDARPYILTGAVARPAAMRGIDITLAPISLYAYWLERDPTLKGFHEAAPAPVRQKVAAD